MTSANTCACMQTEACGCGLIAALIAMLKAEDSDCQAAAAALLHVLAAATQISRYPCCAISAASLLPSELHSCWLRAVSLLHPYSSNCSPAASLLHACCMPAAISAEFLLPPCCHPCLHSCCCHCLYACCHCCLHPWSCILGACVTPTHCTLHRHASQADLNAFRASSQKPAGDA